MLCGLIPKLCWKRYGNFMKILILSILAIAWLVLAFFYSKRSGICVVLILAGCFAGGYISELIAPGRWGFPKAFIFLLPIGAGIGLFTGLWLTRGPQVPHRRLLHGMVTGALFLFLLLVVYKYPVKLAEYVAANGLYRTAGLLAYSGILPGEQAQKTILLEAPDSLKQWIVLGMLTGHEHPVAAQSEVQAYWGRWRVLRSLHENGQDALLQRAVLFLTEKSGDGREDLFNKVTYANKDGDYSFVETLFAHGLSPDFTNAEGIPAIVRVSQSQNWALAGVFLAAGAKPDLTDPHGFSALSWAVIHGNPEFAGKLIRAGANPRILLHTAQINPQADYLTIPYNRQGASLLHLAAIAGALECVPLLLENGLDPKSTDAQGVQPIFFAAYRGKAPVISLLAAAGASPNAADDEGLSPLHLAMTWGAEHELPVSEPVRRYAPIKDSKPEKQARFISLLLAAGVSPHSTDSQGRSLMHYAAVDAVDDVESIKTLLEDGADVDQRDSRGRTPFSILEERILGDGAYARSNPLENSSEKKWRRAAEKKKENDILELFSKKRFGAGAPG